MKAIQRSADSQIAKSLAPRAAVCFPVLPTAQRAPAARLLHTPAALCHVPYARRAPGQLPWDPFVARAPPRLPAGHAEQAHALGRDAPTCFVSDPVKVRPATDPACHGLPPPRLLTLFVRRCRAVPRWQPLVTHALFASATPCPHASPVNTGSRTCTACALPTRPLSYASSLLPWQVRHGDPQAASAALSDAVQSDAALPDAAACCNAPPAFPGHSPCPRAAAALARHHRTIRPPPSLGLLTPPPPPGRCRQHRLMRALPLRRVVIVGPCLYRVLYVRVACVRPRRVRGTARDVQCLKVCLCIIHK